MKQTVFHHLPASRIREAGDFSIRQGSVMLYKFLAAFIVFLALSGCSGQVTTASEPDFVLISADAATLADAEMYALLSTLEPAPADRIALAVAIQGLDPRSLPKPRSQPPATYEVGDKREFWTHNSDTLEFNRITAELMWISNHAYFWQDVDSPPFNAAGEMATVKDWMAAGESFDNSYERVRAMFGSEESPGLDGDARLFVIHSDSLGLVGGYFGQADQLPAAVEAHSNEGQYFFISNTGSSGIASEYYKEVLAHEFQHMIQKNVDPNEDGWMNEGLSMFAQQAAGMRGHNFVADYLLKPDQSLWYWSGEAQDYGQAYLYLNYLYEQLGDEFMRVLAADPANGLASIDRTLAEFNSLRGADDFYADAITAAFFNNPAVEDGRFAYRIPPIPEVKPRYEFASLPAVYQGRVRQYGGVDIVTFTGKGQRALTFTGDQRVKLIPAEAHSGERFWWSNRYDSTFVTLTRKVDLKTVSRATLKYWAWYDIEEDWDYAYLLVSTDGGRHWTLLPATSSRRSDPNHQNLGHGFSGKSGSGNEAVWIEETADLSEFAGQRILIRFAMQNDLVVNNFGFAVDDVSIPEIGWNDGFESGASDWVADGFVLTHNSVPQVWRVRAVEEGADGSIAVHDVEIANGTGGLNVNFDGIERLVVFVIGQTRHTDVPGAYRVEVR